MGVATKPIHFVPPDSKLVFLRKKTAGFRSRPLNIRITATAVYKCICGTEKELVISDVKRGKTKSCGCYKDNQIKSVTKHGLWNTPLYNIWFSIKRRCKNKKNTAYKWYGGRGVKICKEWDDDFMSFYNWAMDNGWEPGLDVDKDIIPKKLNIPALLYSPEMCSLVTEKKNQNNKSSNVCILYKGETKTISEWADHFGMKYATLHSRIRKQKWSFKKSISTPIIK